MFAPAFSRTLRRSLLALALGACASLASASAMHVELDTTGMGSDGWLDLQFGALGGAALASADLSNFSGFNGAIAAESAGDVSGSLASGYHIGNDPGNWNDLFQAVHLGGKVGFDVSFSGAADPSAATLQSAFTVALYGDHDAQNVLGTPGADGFLLTLNWTPAKVAGGAGSVDAQVFDAGVAGVSAVPEPSSWLMLGAGLALLGMLRRRRA